MRKSGRKPHFFQGEIKNDEPVVRVHSMLIFYWYEIDSKGKRKKGEREVKSNSPSFSEVDFSFFKKQPSFNFEGSEWATFSTK